MTPIFPLPNSWMQRTISVAVIGVGGTGSALCTELFQMHSLLQTLSNGETGLAVTLYDPDSVSPFNVGRQGFYSADVGHPKAEVLATRFNQWGGTKWRYHNECFRVRDASRYDVLLVCVDTAAFRVELGRHWARRTTDTLWLDTGVDSHSGTVTLGHLGRPNDNGVRLPNALDLFPHLEAVQDDNEDSCSTEQALASQDFGVNKFAALTAAQMLWQLLRHGQLQYTTQMYDLRSGVTASTAPDPAQWAMFGYHPGD